MKNRVAARVGLLFSAFLMGTSAHAAAQERPKASAESGDFCGRAAIKKIIVDTLNTSRDLQERKIKIVDFRNTKMLTADPAKNSFSCHGTMLLSGGEKFTGVLSMAAPGNTTSIDWYDDDSENGLMQFTSAEPSVPADEAEFIKILALARGNYENAKTDFAKGATRPQRAKLICAALKSTQARGWKGKIVRLTTNGDGKGVFAVEIATSVTLKTFSVQLADIGSNTLIEPNSKLFGNLGELSIGDQVKFSGSFIANETDCFQETSLTMNGSLISAGFVMRFVDVQKTSY